MKKSKKKSSKKAVRKSKPKPLRYVSPVETPQVTTGNVLPPTQELFPNDSPNDPRKHFIPTELFRQLWKLEEKYNVYNNEKMAFAARRAVSPPLVDLNIEEQKLLDKHFPPVIKKTFWQNLKELI